MDHNPKKSRAFIITFIAVIVLLIGGYLLFKNSDKIFNTNGISGTNKTFAPLLGSSKPKDLNVINGGALGTSGTNTTTGGTGSESTNGTSGGTTGSSGSVTNTTVNNGSGVNNTVGVNNATGVNNQAGVGNGSGVTTPGFNPLPIPNYGSGAVTSTPTITSTPTVTPGYTPPTISTVTPESNPNMCPVDDPLVFTDAERTELDSLLRDYYLIAPKLKTNDDMYLIDNDMTTNKSLVDQANGLIAQCQSQKANLTYGGPQAVKNNPYYTDPTNSGTTFYLPEYSQLEALLKIW